MRIFLCLIVMGLTLGCSGEKSQRVDVRIQGEYSKLRDQLNFQLDQNLNELRTGQKAHPAELQNIAQKISAIGSFVPLNGFVELFSVETYFLNQTSFNQVHSAGPIIVDSIGIWVGCENGKDQIGRPAVCQDNPVWSNLRFSVQTPENGVLTFEESIGHRVKQLAKSEYLDAAGTKPQIRVLPALVAIESVGGFSLSLETIGVDVTWAIARVNYRSYPKSLAQRFLQFQNRIKEIASRVSNLKDETHNVKLELERVKLEVEEAFDLLP